MILGAGWKLSAQECVSSVTLTGDDLQTLYWVYTDGDGTEHFFRKEGTVWKDEDISKSPRMVGIPATFAIDAIEIAQFRLYGQQINTQRKAQATRPHGAKNYIIVKRSHNPILFIIHHQK